MPPEHQAEPVLSVIVPCYKVKGYVAACVRSLFRQTLQEPFEIILVDDCDPDRSVEEVEGIGREKPAHVTLRRLHHERNRGLSAARNTGTDAAAGGYIIYVDSDDKLYPHALASMLAEVRRTRADVAVGVTRQDPPLEGYGIRPHSSGILQGKEAFDAYMERRIDMTAWNKLVRKGFLEEHHISFHEGMLHEDEVWNIDMLLAGAVWTCWDGEATYLYRTQRGGSIMAVAELERLHLRINYCNICTAALDAAGYGGDTLAHMRFASVVSNALLRIFRNTPRTGAWAAWRMCRKLATQLQTATPAFRRYLAAYEFRMCRHIARLLALPWGLRQPALTLYCLHLSRVIGYIRPE